MKIVGLINARGGSKGIPKKNIYPFAGKPLIAHSILLAKQTLDEVYVSTDSNEIATISRQLGARIIERPKELANDDSVQYFVIKHAQKKIQADVLVLLQPTNPVRTIDTVERALKAFNDYDSLMSYYEDVCKNVVIENGCLKAANIAWKDNNRQDVKNKYREAGTIYIYRKEFLSQDNIYGQRVCPFLVSKQEALDIDDLDDLAIAEAIFEKSNCFS